MVNPLWPPGRGGEAPDATCASCVWRRPGKVVDRCLRHRRARVRGEWPACPAYTAEAALDCLACAACCREAFHTVELGRRDPFVRRHPELVVERDGRLQLPRGTRCPCLQADNRCVHYEDRPRTCRDFERASANCVEARRRVGLTL